MALKSSGKAFLLMYFVILRSGLVIDLFSPNIN